MAKTFYDLDKEGLEALYRFHTYAEIAAKFRVNPETVRRKLHVFGIKTRGSGPKRTFTPTREELDRLYQQFSIKQIARQSGVGETVVWKRLQEFGIKLKGHEDGGHRKKPGRQFSRAHRRNLSKAHEGRWEGEKNPNWKGGVYDSNLRLRRTGRYKQWRLDALALRNSCCEGCGVKQDTVCECCGLKIRLHVHHKMGFSKHLDQRFDPTNSEVLCPKCHRTRHAGKSGELLETLTG